MLALLRRLVTAGLIDITPDVNAPGHMDDGDNVAEVIFDELNPQAAYDFNNATCTNTPPGSFTWIRRALSRRRRRLPRRGR